MNPPDRSRPRAVTLRPAASGTRPRRGRAGGIGLTGLIAVGLLTAAACGDGDDGTAAGAERQEDVAERGAEVMPFDLDATTHGFEPVADGLVQTIRADDPAETEQIDLIREHLEEEAERFSAGDYGDPTTIHGADMPGLADLEAGASDIAITYEPTPQGGRITYVTGDATLVDALHEWGEAQLTDHGSHAESGA